MISILILSKWPGILQGPLKKREVGWCRCQSKIKRQQAIFKKQNKKTTVCNEAFEYFNIDAYFNERLLQIGRPYLQTHCELKLANYLTEHLNNFKIHLCV
jgi:hypothetical protein